MIENRHRFLKTPSLLILMSNINWMNGDIEIDKINQIFKTNVPEGDDYASLNGLLHEKLQDIPKEGDKIEVDSLRIIVEKVTKNKPEKIRIEKII